jgi:hypothetical protein
MAGIIAEGKGMSPCACLKVGVVDSAIEVCATVGTPNAN